MPIGWGVNITTSSSDAWTACCTHYTGIRGGWVMACTMEPINKNPVTGSYAFYASRRQRAASPAPARGRVTRRIRRPLSGSFARTGRSPTSVPNASMSNFRSDHPSGALFLFCDGHVQFLNENIDMGTYTASATIQGGESVQGAVGEP